MRIGIVAGEASGDLLGAGLIRALQQQVPELQVEGIGGPQMIAAGCDSLFSMEELSVMGLVEVLRHLPRLLSIRKQLVRRWLANPPDVVIGIDAPDFNLGLEERLRQAGIRTMHYVSPSVWAWRRKRVHQIKRAVDHILTLFPFEEDFYHEYQVPVTCVGHPLADMIPLAPDHLAARKTLALDADQRVVALLPGSRRGEVSRLAPVFIETALQLSEAYPGLAFVVPFANQATRQLFEEVLMRYAPHPLNLRLVDGQARTVMTAADVVLLASGTATLEAMLAKRPMVVAYRLNALTYLILKRLVRIPFYALPNLLAGRLLVPELIQDKARPDRLAQAVKAFLIDPHRSEVLAEEFLRLHEQLRRNADIQAASAVLAVCRGEA